MTGAECSALIETGLSDIIDSPQQQHTHIRYCSRPKEYLMQRSQRRSERQDIERTGRTGPGRTTAALINQTLPVVPSYDVQPCELIVASEIASPTNAERLPRPCPCRTCVDASKAYRYGDAKGRKRLRRQQRLLIPYCTLGTSASTRR